jgi:hypothetical protein
MNASFLVAFFTTPWRKGQTPKNEEQKKCQVVISKGSYDGKNEDEINPNGKHQ